MYQLLLSFGCRPQVAMMPFQKLQAFGLYLSKLNFLLCLLLLGSLKTYVVGIFGNQSMSVGGLRTYLRFSMVHGCRWCSALAVCSHYSCCDSGSCQCTSLISCTECYYVQVIFFIFFWSFWLRNLPVSMIAWRCWSMLHFFLS